MSETVSGTQGSQGPSGTPDVDVAGILAGLAERRPDPADAPAVSGWMLGALGVLHAPVYRSRELRGRLADLGVTEAMAAYLTQRSAPLGPAGPQLVAATFYGFSPTAIATHLPAVWDLVPPDEVVALTLDAMRELLARLIGDHVAMVAELVALLAPVADAHAIVGRPLAAAWASVPRTGEPLVDLWLATSVIRESRGDGHIALLVAEDIGPIESHLVTAGDDPERRAMFQALRGWTAAEVDAMYRVMAIANYEDRFVIPSTHREYAENAFNVRGGCGFSFGNGCSEGVSETSLFGSEKKRTIPIKAEV